MISSLTAPPAGRLAQIKTLAMPSGGTVSASAALAIVFAGGAAGPDVKPPEAPPANTIQLLVPTGAGWRRAAFAVLP